MKEIFSWGYAILRNSRITIFQRKKATHDDDDDVRRQRKIWWEGERQNIIQVVEYTDFSSVRFPPTPEGYIYIAILTRIEMEREKEWNLAFILNAAKTWSSAAYHMANIQQQYTYEAHTHTVEHHQNQKNRNAACYF